MCSFDDPFFMCMYAQSEDSLCNETGTEYHAGISAARIRDQIIKILSDSGNETEPGFMERIAYCAVTVCIIQ